MTSNLYDRLADAILSTPDGRAIAETVRAELRDGFNGELRDATVRMSEQRLAALRAERDRTFREPRTALRDRRLHQLVERIRAAEGDLAAALRDRDCELGRRLERARRRAAMERPR